jgi:FAD/FMN-containing dehydrogenase
MITGVWTNWAGNVVAAPRVLARPVSLAELRAVVVAASRRGDGVRVAGAGHSFAPLCATDGVLIDLSLMSGVEHVDPESGEAMIRAGTRISDLGAPLLAHGRALANQGDIDTQAIGGAIATGTHGTGRKHGSFSAMVRAVELMRADGELVTIDGLEPDLLGSAALSLGLLGVMTRVSLATVPAYKLRQRTQVLGFAECLDRFPAEEERCRNAEFWWLPAHDRCVLKTCEETDGAPFHVAAADAPPGTIERYLKPELVDWSWRVYPSTRNVPFVEMEYTMPLAIGPAAMREVRHLMRTYHPDCTWAVEYRTQPGEELYLSPTQGQQSVTISLHQAIDLPYEPLFRDAETTFRGHGGRPHWGKIHFLDREEIAQLYPALPLFNAIRAELDPRGTSTNDFLTRLGLGGDRSSPVR